MSTIALPGGSWTSSSQGPLYLGNFGGTPTLTALLAQADGLLGNAVTCCNSGDSFVNNNGCFQFDGSNGMGATTAAQLPGGSWWQSALNPSWCPVSQLVTPSSTFPFIRDIAGNFQSIRASNLVYVCATLGGNSSFPQTTIALQSTALSNQESLFQIEGTSAAGVNLMAAGLQSCDVSVPGGTWSGSSSGSPLVVPYYGNYLLIATLKCADGSTRVACATFSPGDEFSNSNGYFQYSTMSPNTQANLPQGSWVKSASDVMWAPVGQFLAQGAVVPTATSGSISATSLYSSYISCFLGSGISTTFFASVPMDLQNSNGLIQLQNNNPNSNFLLSLLEKAAEFALDAAEDIAEDAPEAALLA